ncbi:hypothetical protein LEM8419_02610 [Neolewinella maritima]|uniref:Lipoprotein n=1 Tax=Neolewinella maritima TaxID=1383882 RepID=A0ABM9B3E6_9BACT|nr:hypothetical protein [Neolewinella maritima]CAH1001704.1 hypothetical protein LEM8419_02610 [Neolewinella maritima]
MRNKLTISILIITWLCSCGQRSNSKREEVAVKSEVEATTKNNSRLSQNPDLEKFIYTDTTYTLSKGEKITIQNSFPKGGMIEPNGTQYVDSTGKSHGFASFWTRIINHTDIALGLNMNVPAGSFPIFTSPDSYLKLFLPKQKFSFDKLSNFNYGLTDIKSYLDANFDKAAMLQKTINPNEDYIFYVMALSYEASGIPRGGLTLKEQDLYYKVSVAPHGSGAVPVGKITIKY